MTTQLQLINITIIIIIIIIITAPSSVLAGILIQLYESWKIRNSVSQTAGGPQTESIRE